MDGELGKFVRTQIAAKAGLVAMDRMWDLGFRQITTSTKPIKTAADLVGLKIRVPGRAQPGDAVQGAEGGAAVDAVHRGLFGAADPHRRRAGEPADADQGDQALRGAEVLLDHQPCLGRPLDVLQRRRVEGAAGRSEGDRRAQPQRGAHCASATISPRAIASVQADLEKAGLVFNTAETQSFRDGLKSGGFYKDWRAKLGDEPWEILERYAGKLG